jgi:hypothetical protein
MSMRNTARTATVRRHRRAAPAAITPVALLLVPFLLGGCASGGSGLKNPFRGPTEAGFMSLVQHNCGSEVIGGQPISTLIKSNTSFRQLTSRLYQGDISNDAFMNLLLQEYPAPDANIPATGCVVDQLNRCFATKCGGGTAEPPDDIAAQQIDATRNANVEELPKRNVEAVDSMIDAAPEPSVPEQLGPLPSQDPSVINPSMMNTEPESVQKIEEPSKP